MYMCKVVCSSKGRLGYPLRKGLPWIETALLVRDTDELRVHPVIKQL